MVAIDAAKIGSQTALKYYRRKNEGLKMRLKEDTSIVTIADTKTEEAIKKHILSNFPRAEFIAEESKSTVKDSSNVWIVDPIDGSTEFSRGIDMWGIMIAHAGLGQVICGVCFFPVLDILLYAENGKGAYINDFKLQVSGVSELSEAFMGFSSMKYFIGKEKETLLQVIDHVRTARGFLSSFSEYCVSSGKLDFFITSSHNGIWDIAPFICIIKEAGGKVSDWEGNELNIRDGSTNMLVSNGKLHEQIIKVINS